MTENLEEILAELCKYGEPILHKLDDGWICRVDFFVTGAGVQFKVGSDYDHPTPLEAAQVCFDRVKEALNKLIEFKFDDQLPQISR